MYSCTRSCLAATVVLYGLLASLPMASAQTNRQAKHRIEVVFCLDTTASMKGLLNLARKKIWTISNQIVAGKPTPELRVGLVAYRDLGDVKKSYVTKTFPLTSELLSVYQSLLELEAAGGGDHPESVNQALHEAVHKMKWTKGKNVLRIIFLVGDAPPHMDYKDDVKYPKTCEIAAKRGIIINTVQCGIHPVTAKHWKAISTLAKGSYVQIGHDGGADQSQPTPYDEKLATINRELTKSTLPFGNRRMRLQAEAKRQALMNLPRAQAAERSGYVGRSRRAASYDLLQAINDGKFKLSELRKSDLPPELQKLNPKAQERYLKELEKKRNKLLKDAYKLDQKRRAYIRDKEAEKIRRGDLGTFDREVLKILQRQAKRIDVKYPAVKSKK